MSQLSLLNSTTLKAFKYEHLPSVPLVDRISSGETGAATLQDKVENVFSVPVKVNAGDYVVVIYSRSGNGATDNETQVHALMAP